MSPTDSTNAQLWNQDFNQAFGVFMSRLKNEPLAVSRAAAYAKQEHRKRQQQNTQLPAGGPPPVGGPPSGSGIGPRPNTTGLINLGPS